MAKRSFKPGKHDLSVKRSRTGLGLFTNEDIPRGACVIEYTGVRLTEKEYKASNSKYLFEVGGKGALDGSPRWNTARYINHSCRPNCEPDTRGGRAFIFAKRNIKAGEELNYDYGNDYFDEYINGSCLCRMCSPPLNDKNAIVVKPKKITAKRKERPNRDAKSP
ncbi:MAG: SET domain-containing protein [Hyphomonadaceae bacterium]|nr:SET domain-containing protein [Hyphomonadaceae bacterium]